MVCVGTVSLLSWEYLQPGTRKIKHIKVYVSKGEGVTARLHGTWSVLGNIGVETQWAIVLLCNIHTYVYRPFDTEHINLEQNQTKLNAGSFSSVNHHCLHAVFIIACTQFSSLPAHSFIYSLVCQWSHLAYASPRPQIPLISHWSRRGVSSLHEMRNWEAWLSVVVLQS